MFKLLTKKTTLLSFGGALAIALTGLFVGMTWADDKPDMLAEGDRQFAEKSYRKAYEAYEQYLKDNPESDQWFRVKLRMGHSQAQLGNYDKAEIELTTLADSDKLTDIEKGRASYRLGHFYVTRPHYYYENSKGEKSWGRWITDSTYHHTEHEDIKRAKDRLAASFELLEPAARESLKKLGEDADAIEMIEEAYNAGLDSAAALHTWQYQQGQQQKTIDYFDSNEQKQTYYYYVYEFKDRDEIIKRHDALVKLADELKQTAQKLLIQKRAYPADVKARLDEAPARADNMAALATYRKGSFMVSMAQIDDWYTQNMLYHPDMQDFDPLAGEYSPIPSLEKVYKDYHHTSYADDAQYFIGYCYQQVGRHTDAVGAYKVLIADEAFKDSTETSSAKYNLQQLLAQRLSVQTIARDVNIEDEKKVRKWPNNASWNFRESPGTSRSLFKKGEHIGLWVESRNAKQFDVRALTFDVSGMMKDNDFLQAHTSGFHHINDGVISKIVDKYIGEEVFTQTYTTGDDGNHNYTRLTFELPQTLPAGSYLLEVDTGEAGIMHRSLAVVTDAQVVIQTYNPDENLVLMLDSESGAPLADTSFIYKRWFTSWDGNKTVWHIDVSRYKSDAQGRVRVPTVGNGNWNGYLLYAENNGRYAWVQDGFPWWQRRGWNDYSTYDTRMYPMTDRPVYRPGDEVHGKVILRQRDGGEWKNVNGGSFRIELYNTRGEEKLAKNIRATEFGALEFDLPLAKDAALGAWYYYVRAGNGNWIGSGTFQVEEYKKPEFEVMVTPPDKPVKLGQALTATIKGEYYFGGPAAGADVTYKVYRDFYFHSVYFPRRFDWLYNWQTPLYYGTPDQQFYRNSSSELILDNKGKLNEQGELIIEWSTQKALEEWGKFDHNYRVEAEVTDSSRRTITGSGSVKALRRAFFAFVDNKLGFYRPGDKLDVEVRTVTADDKPVQTAGKLEIYKVTFVKGVDEEGMTKIDELKTLLGTHELNTDERGLAWWNEPFSEAGTFELVYRTKDEWDSEIVGQTRVIVKADQWIPGSFRFGTISLIPQQKVYTQGETARVLLASDFNDAWMLISVMGGNEVITQSFVDMQKTGGQLELELTVGREHLPNFHINVLTVRRGELHTQTCELFVPPVDQFLDVQITSDKEWYLPGEKGTVSVIAKDKDGNPVQAEFALSIYDRSITYIMPDRTPNIIKHFYGDRRSYRLNFVNSYNTGVSPAQWDRQKYETLRWFGAPLGYGVHDWIQWERNAFNFQDELARTKTGKADRFARGFDNDRSTVEKREQQEDPSDKAKDSLGGLRERSARKGGRQMDGEGGEDGGWGGAAGGKNADDMAPGEPAADAKKAESNNALGEAEEEKELLDKSLEEVAEDAGAASPRVRSNFKDTVFYSHSVITGKDGKATINVEFPDNLTDWRITAHGITSVAKVGEAFHAVKTKKQLILRDQAPRFFVEGDVVTLSGIIMNRYDTDLAVKAMVMLNPTEGAGESERAGYCDYELFPETQDVQDITVPANGEVRVDWRVRMTSAGQFKIRMLALSAIESDATEKTYPCKVRGAEMYQATTSVIKDGEKSQTFEVNLPDKLDPEQTNLDLQLSPSVAALAMDALPYLLEYPYGCVEQTMSRFLPAVIVQKTLKDANVSLEEIGARRAKLDYSGVNPQAAYWYKRNPVFNTNTMNSIIDFGLQRIAIMQHSDGGWGWWQAGQSDTYMSAYVCYGLQTAKDAGVKFDYSMLDRGISFISRLARTEKNLHRVAYIAYVMSYAGQPDKELLDLIYNRRDDLTHQSRAMVCMAEYLANDKERARILISNIEDYRKEDLENGTVWWDGGKEYWWWYNDKIETNAFVMQAFVMVDPKNAYLEKHVRWLAQNRKGSRWNSTKDTSHAVSALMAYARATGELSRSYTVNVKMDGKEIHRWEVTPENIFALQTNLRLNSQTLTPGKHTFEITREGEGKVYFSSFLSYFSKEDHLAASGNEIHIDRKYYKLVEKVVEVDVPNETGEGTHKEKRVTFDREPLEDGAKLVSGDKIEVELNLKADNDYEYLAFEDFKPAGCEPVALRSGQGYAGGLCQNVELRDDRVAFFVSYMPQGTARLKYQLRCEIPGTFSALPTQGGSMYVAEVRANSEEWKCTITDK
ncbi:MAG: hypothetical protein K8I27_17185 [Planctomycetes bacterium]|nr:hypothetical protein [Planctomycetota bacterium]